jgi:hypothetical protein
VQVLVLDDRERELLRLLFDCDLIQSAIGAGLGISQMHVSRLIRAALARLREASDRAAETTTEQPQSGVSSIARGAGTPKRQRLSAAMEISPLGR